MLHRLQKVDMIALITFLLLLQCHPMEQDDPSISDDVYLLACKLIRYFDTVEQQEPQYVHSRILIIIII